MTSKQLHDKAISLIEIALIHKHGKKRHEYKKNMYEALSFEERAAKVAELEKVDQGTISILYKSCAAMAFELKYYEKSISLANEGISDDTPQDVLEELSLLIKTAQGLLKEQKAIMNEKGKTEGEQELMEIGSSQPSKVKQTNKVLKIAHSLKSIINENPTIKIDLLKIANDFNVSRALLKHYFKTSFGIGYEIYIQMEIVKKAKELLSDGTLSVAEIANRFGYTNPRSFINVYKSMTGSSIIRNTQSSKKNKKS
jgi:AraC-like DNA-binding protein